MANINKFSAYTIFLVIKSYLIDSKSHRAIQEEILNMDAPARGGGFIAMQILHSYGIHGDKKGALKRRTLEEEYQIAKGQYKVALDIIKKNM